MTSSLLRLRRALQLRARFPRLSSTLALLALSAPLLPAAQAQALGNAAQNPSVYVQGGWAERGTDSATLGVTLPWNAWRTELWGSELRGHWDVYLSRWSFDPRAGQPGHTLLLGVTPTLRLRPDQGRSPWFLEGGIGATVSDDRYITVRKEFGTRFNFASHLGFGLNFGEERRHELSLRLEHVSNGGIKKPNPGENFLQLRYAYHF